MRMEIVLLSALFRGLRSASSGSWMVRHGLWKSSIFLPASTPGSPQAPSPGVSIAPYACVTYHKSFTTNGLRNVELLSCPLLNIAIFQRRCFGDDLTRVVDGRGDNTVPRKKSSTFIFIRCFHALRARDD